MAKEEIQLDLTPDEIQILQDLAEEKNITVDELIEQLLYEFLNNIENPVSE